MLHIHKWSTWKNVTYGATRLYRGYTFKGDREGQESTCLKCGFTRSRML
jgi:hypothetical protein